MEKLGVEDNYVNQSYSLPHHTQDLVSTESLLCPCGTEVGVKEIGSHYSKCKEMKEKYQLLFKVVDKFISKKAEDLQDWANLKVLFNFLENHIKMMINKEQKKPSQFRHKPNRSSAESYQNQPSLSKHYEEEKDMSVDFKHPNFEKRQNHQNKRFEEDKFEVNNMVYRQESMQRCPACQKYITPVDEREENLLILECAHSVHKDCMKQSAKRQYMDNQIIKC